MSSTSARLKPDWFQPDAPAGSAVRYLASLCGQAAGVELVYLDGRRRRKGPSIGACQGKRALELPVAGRRPAAEIHLYMLPGCQLGPQEHQKIFKVVQELGELWPRK